MQVKDFEYKVWSVEKGAWKLLKYNNYTVINEIDYDYFWYLS